MKFSYVVEIEIERKEGPNRTAPEIARRIEAALADAEREFDDPEWLENGDVSVWETSRWDVRAHAHV